MKNNIYLLFVVFFIFTVPSCTKKPEFLKKYPYGLITNTDYGILNENDLAVETLNVDKTKKFSASDKTSPYNRWQCFKTSNIKTDCEATIFDEDYKEQMGVLEITIKEKGEQHLYVIRHALYLSACLDYKKELEQVINGEKCFCILGEFISKENDEYSWIYSKLKTKKGCHEWFEGTCDYSHWTKNEGYKIVK